ncbi:hypothetical protein VPH35_133464 [Triticum aestivum]
MTPSVRLLPLTLLVILCTMPLPSSWGAMSMNHDRLMIGRFHRWMAVHNRSYPNAGEKLRRSEMYRRNMEYIEAMNMNGSLSYRLGENKFTGLSNEEFGARYYGANFINDHGADVDDPIITTLAGDVYERRGTMGYNVNAVIPENFDWRDKGAVTPAKEQNPCGSCWAFAAVEVLEDRNNIRNIELLGLFEQELVDCDNLDHGCHGGWPFRTFQWIKGKGGIPTESEYPYMAREQGYYRIEKSHVRVGKITDIVRVPTDEQLMLWIMLTTPVTVVINVGGRPLQHFANGIYTGPCGHKLNHAMAVVGYGVRVQEKDWIVKNSWGPTWGENGFILMGRGVGGESGLCGIAMDVVYALIESY